MFNEAKNAQIAAYLLSKDNCRMAHLKLMVLLYLADRESMDRFGFPVTDDQMVSMVHGPGLAKTLDLMNGREQGANWCKWIGCADNELVLRFPDAVRDDYDELSKADLMILDAVYSRFGYMGPQQICKHAREYCAEWSDPDGNSFAISPESVFRALGKPEYLVKALSDQLREFNELKKITGGMV